MPWESYGSDHSLVLHENNWGERYRVSIENAEEFTQDECYAIQEQADNYFTNQYVDDISFANTYAGPSFIVDFERGELLNDICIRLYVARR